MLAILTRKTEKCQNAKHGSGRLKLAKPVKLTKITGFNDQNWPEMSPFALRPVFVTLYAHGTLLTRMAPFWPRENHDFGLEKTMILVENGPEIP